MATISRDFGEISVDPATRRVRVDGTTRDDDLDAIVTQDPAAQICISIIGLHGHAPLAAEVDTPAPGGWSALFENACPPVKPGDLLKVVGIALTPGKPPYAWESPLPITAGTRTPAELPLEDLLLDGP